ncbi:MAG: hypothetical protein LC748_06515 [Thermomicrobia bacterium]|nr:hypothetical protein [Thermomicrobia bacterium]
MDRRVVPGISAIYRWAQANALRAAFLVGLMIAVIGVCVPRIERAHDPGVIGGDPVVQPLPVRTVIGFPLVVWSTPDLHAETDWDFGAWPLRRFFIFWANIWLCGLPALLGLLAHRANTVAFAMPRLLGTLLLTWLAYPMLVVPLLLSHWSAVAPRSLVIYATLLSRAVALSPVVAWSGLALMAVGWLLFAFPLRPFRLPVFIQPPPYSEQPDFERVPMR